MESLGKALITGASSGIGAIYADRLAKRGYDLSSIRSRRVGSADFERFDVVLAMDRDNLDHLSSQCPAALAGRLGLLLQHAPAAGLQEVPDPYYGGVAGFDRVLDLIEPACDGLLLTLQKQLAGH